MGSNCLILESGFQEVSPRKHQCVLMRQCQISAYFYNSNIMVLAPRPRLPEQLSLGEAEQDASLPSALHPVSSCSLQLDYAEPVEIKYL